ncbi:MAG: substrate-binding domain-containing protein [Luteolibacter sp.]|jgi:DNA-binding MarR family transcriptional regulator
MARPRSEHTQLVKEKLIARLKGGFHPPGQRFFSNRGLAGQFGISYQTADRLIRELVDEGWLERRPSAGTYVSGKAIVLHGAALVFHERAKRPGSFGARLLEGLSQALAQAGVASKVVWTRDDQTVAMNDWFPVLWECPRAMTDLAEERRFLLVMNDTPPAGLASSFVDSVACDDFSGGAAAAELLHLRGATGTPVVLAGPESDLRSRQRVAGFRSIAKNVKVFWAKSWDAEAATELAPTILTSRPSQIFCCSDRLAEGLMGSAPALTIPVVGFDDAPVAEKLNLTTIAMPWQEMVDGAVQIIRRRMSGNAGAAAKLIFAPMPVIRKSG